jgi:hypothetical protein
MELIFALGGFIGGVCASVIWIRRALKKPEGKTAKAANVIFGPGPWTPPK